MARSNSLETDYLKLIFQNIALPNIGNSSGLQGSSVVGKLYVALYTTNPTDADTGTEANYTGYARIGVNRSLSGWTVSGNTVQNTASIIFPISSGGSNTITHIGIRTAITGGDLLYSGALGSSVSVSSGDTPKFNSNQIIITAN